jgi:hypothetical protein
VTSIRRSETQDNPQRPRSRTLSLINMDVDPRIVLRAEAGDVNDLIVNHPPQPADYTHTDGTVWTWRQRWLIVGGVPLRLYDLVR